MEAIYYDKGTKKCDDEHGKRKMKNFVYLTKTNSPTGNSGTARLPPIGDSFMYQRNKF